MSYLQRTAQARCHVLGHAKNEMAGMNAKSLCSIPYSHLLQCAGNAVPSTAGMTGKQEREMQGCNACSR